MTYARPETLREAVDWLAANRAVIAAGCTDLFAMTANQTLPGPVLDITAIAGLSGITRTSDGWRIGASTKWSAIAKADLLPAFDGLKLAAREVGSVQIQNSGTIGGNLCNASPAADGVPPLLVLDAQVEITGAAGTRQMKLADFITGPRRMALLPGELLTAILIPEAATSGRSHFLKLGARKSLVISIVMVAAKLVVENGRIRSAAIAVGSCSPVATRLPALEAALAGVEAAKAADIVSDSLLADALSPITDVRADGAYRREGARELVARAIASLAQGERA